MKSHEYEDSPGKYHVPIPQGGAAPTAQGASSRSRSQAKVNALSDLAGKRVGLYWNTKPNGDVFLSRLAELIEEKFGITIVSFFPGKADTSQAISEAVLNKIRDTCDVVVLATAD
jgi:hypothetical protein